MANGILIIDKPQDWTSSGLDLMERGTAGAIPLIPAAGPSSSRQTRCAGLCREKANPLRWALPRETGVSQCLTEF